MKLEVTIFSTALMSLLSSDKVRVIGLSEEEPAIVQVWESSPPYSSWERWSTTLCSVSSVACEDIKVVYNSQRRTYIAVVESETATVRVTVTSLVKKNPRVTIVHCILRLYCCVRIACKGCTYHLCLQTQVYVIEEGGGFKFFQLPSHFVPTNIVYHSTTSTVYVVGNEVCVCLQQTICVLLLADFLLTTYRFGCQWMVDQLLAISIPF